MCELVRSPLGVWLECGRGPFVGVLRLRGGLVRSWGRGGSLPFGVGLDACRVTSVTTRGDRRVKVGGGVVRMAREWVRMRDGMNDGEER